MSYAEMIQQEKVAIQQTGLSVQALLHPEGAAIDELLSGGISPARIAALYPLEMSQMTEGLEARLLPSGRGRIMEFALLLKDVEYQLKPLRTALSDDDDNAMVSASMHFVQDSALLRAVSESEGGALWPSLTSVGDLIFLADAWGGFTGPVIIEGQRLLGQLQVLRRALTF